MSQSLAIQTGEFVIDILMSLSFFSIFITFFFFVIVTQIEVLTVKKNTQRTIQELFSDLKAVLPPEDQAILTDIFNNNLTVPDLTEEDQQVQDKNNELVKQAVLWLGVFALIAFVIVLAIWGYMKTAYPNEYPSLMGMIKSNLIILFWVAVAELSFLFLITLQYRSIDPNTIRESVVDSLLDFINTP
mgnify:CR=1 FL=1